MTAICCTNFQGLILPQPWSDFLAELQVESYQAFLHRMLGPAPFLLTFESALCLAGLFGFTALRCCA
jgi:hypothetical protein